MPEFYVKKGNTNKALSAQLKDENGPIPILNSTVKFQMKHAVTGAIKVDSSNVTIHPDQSGPNKGTVSYIFDTLDVDTVAVYKGEFQVTFPDLTQLEFPTDKNDKRNWIWIFVVDTV